VYPPCCVSHFLRVSFPRSCRIAKRIVCAVCRTRPIRVRLSVAIAIVASRRAARSAVMCDFPRATIDRSAGCGPLALAHSSGPLVAIRRRLLFKGRAATSATVAFPPCASDERIFVRRATYRFRARSPRGAWNGECDLRRDSSRVYPHREQSNRDSRNEI